MYVKGGKSRLLAAFFYMSLTVGRIKQGDLMIAGQVDERRPPVTDGLVGHWPLDGNTNSYRFSPLGLRVLYEANADTAGGYQFTQWMSANGAIITQSTDLTTVTVATAQTYDLIIADFSVWGVASTTMDTLKTFVDNGVSCVAMGNDTRTNVFVSSYDATAHATHDIQLDPLFPVYTSTTLYAGAGSSDLYGGITGLNSGAKPLAYRTDAPTNITAYWYEGPTGAVLYFDQQGISLQEYMKNMALWAASRTTANATATNVIWTEEGAGVTRGASNLIATSSGADTYFDTSRGWTLLNDTNYTSAIEYNAGAVYGKGLVLRVTDNDGNTSTSEWGGISASTITGLTAQNYTMTIRFKVTGWTTGSIAVWSHQQNSSGGDTPDDYGLPSSMFDGQWHTYSVTKAQASGYDKRTIQIGMDKANLGATIYVDAIQFEAGSFPTPFTNGTSSNTTLKITTPMSTYTSAWTFQFQYKHPSLSSYGSNMVFASSYDGTNTGNWFGLNASTNTITCMSGGTSPTDVWNTATFVYDGTNTNMYINGVYKGNQAGRFFFDRDLMSFSSMIGWNTSTYLAPHYIRNVAFYNKALSGTQLQKLMKGSFNIQKDGTVPTMVKEKSTVPLASKALLFPLDVDGMDIAKRIAPVTESNTVYEQGAVWVGNATTNVITNTDWSNWTTSYLSNVQYESVGPNGIISKVISFVDADGTTGGSYLYCYGDYAPQDPSTTYTVSVWVKTEAPLTFRAYTADNTESSAGYRQYTNSMTVNPEDGWKRVVFNSFTTPVGSTSDSLSFTFDTITANKRVWMCAPQMEASSFATPYVIGTRGESRLQYANNIINLGSDFTIMGWWKPYTIGDGTYNAALQFNTQASGTYKRILIMESSTSGTNPKVWLPNTASTENTIVLTDHSIQTGVWNFFALKRTGVDVVFYHGCKGGFSYATGSGYASGLDYLVPLIDSSLTWNIGQYAGGATNMGNGYYRDYAFIASALSDSTIESIYRAQLRAYKDNSITVQAQVKEGKVL
jgi:hypothetical protein